MVERGENEKQRKRGEKKQGGKKHLGSPLRKRGGLDQALWSV